MDTLRAVKRDMKVKAKRLRREGFVTGNIFGREIEGSIPVQISRRDAERALRGKSKGSRILLDVDGEEMNVLIKDISYSALKYEVDNLDFQALVANEKVHSVAEIVLLNHEKIAAGVLQQTLYEIAYKAYPSALIEKVEIDVGDMHVGDTMEVKDLAIASNPDIDLITHLDSVVATVTETHITEADEDVAPEEETK